MIQNTQRSDKKEHDPRGSSLRKCYQHLIAVYKKISGYNIKFK
jgi:hypothetical protein